MRRENCAPRLAAVALKSALALAACTTAGLALPEAGPATAPTPAQDPLAGPLQERITGKKSPDDVRIDVDWLRGTKPVTARIYGDGVGIWDRSSQFTLTRDQVVAALKVFRDARFGAMPAYFGSDMEGEAESPVRLKGRVVLRIGPQVKRVAQMGDGDQSTGLAGIAEKLLAICAGPAARGKGARSLADGFRLLEEKKLSPQVLSVAVQRGEGSGERWILRVDGRTVTDRVIRPGGTVSVPRRLTLSEADFLAFVRTLNDAQVEALPSNLYARVYTDLRVSLLDHSRGLTAREFHNMKPETHGAKQQSFDRMFAALEALHETAEKNGSPFPEVAVVSEADREREEEKKREREEEQRERDEERARSARPTPIPSPPEP